MEVNDAEPDSLLSLNGKLVLRVALLFVFVFFLSATGDQNGLFWVVMTHPLKTKESNITMHLMFFFAFCLFVCFRIPYSWFVQRGCSFVCSV